MHNFFSWFDFNVHSQNHHSHSIITKHLPKISIYYLEECYEGHEKHWWQRFFSPYDTKMFTILLSSCTMWFICMLQTLVYHFHFQIQFKLNWKCFRKKHWWQLRWLPIAWMYPGIVHVFFSSMHFFLGSWASWLLFLRSKYNIVNF